MADSKKKDKVKPKKAKRGFVLSIGDEGAILTHFDKGTLVNRVFVDSPFSPDIKLMKKLFDLYPSIPITIYVDIIEQNYAHTNLPPLSAGAVKRQAQRKLLRDFQPNDLNNFIPLGREKEGRKDWKYLFISLANAEPFSNWIELVMEQKNKFNGIYVLAIESQNLINELNDKLQENVAHKWELSVMHNKVSGFRISAYKDGKVYFTRLTQHVIGENIAEVVAGNLEQEIVNTIEYLKRLGYSGEKDTHLSIIANEDILKKIELSRLNFSRIDKYTPFLAAEKLNITYAVKEGDKYADILCATHFANQNKKILRFTSKLAKEVMLLQSLIKTVTLIGILGILGALAMSATLLIDKPEKYDAFAIALSKSKESELSLKKLTDRQESLPKDISTRVGFLDTYRKMPQLEGLVESGIYRAAETLPPNLKISEIEINFTDFKIQASQNKVQYSQELSNNSGFSNPFNDAPAQVETEKLTDVTIEHSYTGSLVMSLEVKRSELDILNQIAADLLEKLQANSDAIEFSYKLEPKSVQNEVIEDITDFEDERLNDIISIPTEIEFKGTISEEKTVN